jgi:hypothetical protein
MLILRQMPVAGFLASPFPTTPDLDARRPPRRDFRCPNEVLGGQQWGSASREVIGLLDAPPSSFKQSGAYRAAPVRIGSYTQP